ncbi:MAG: SpoIIE family protein phosphatase [Candidatus Magnetomorum sp.]|nr:SpoIIE family protein phosphatase [Candidatus Magnetomorum sp.]
MSILIVDDSFFNRKLVETFLIKSGYSDILHAESATEAYRQLKNQLPDAPIDLILLDIIMPEIDGIEACGHIKQMHMFKDIPIIMVTAKDESQFLQSAFDAGAIDYITKPVNPTILKARVRSALTLKKEMDRRKAREQDLIDIGAKIQKTLLLGQLPETFPGLEISAFTQASQTIDGDFYDFFCHKDQCLDIFLGDVMGKGVPAALVGAATKANFYRTITQLISEHHIHAMPDVEQIVQHVHEVMSNELIDLETFITLCYARFHAGDQSVELVDCGHTQTIHFHAIQQKCSFIKGENTPLGFIPDEIYQKTKFFLLPGDILFLYSDGFTEACSPEGTFFGEQRLVECIQNHSTEKPSELIKKIHDQVKHFTQTNQLGDDLTCVVLKRTFEKSSPSVLTIKSALSDLQIVRQFISDYCQSIDIGPNPQQFIWQLETATIELISNVIKYAYMGEDHHGIEIHVHTDETRIRLTVYHWGNPFPHPPINPKPPKDKYSEGGYGLFIIDNYIDTCEYSQDGNCRNSIVLIKKWLIS